MIPRRCIFSLAIAVFAVAVFSPASGQNASDDVAKPKEAIVNFEFESTPLRDAIDFLSQFGKTEIVLDQPGLEELSLSADSAISSSAEGVALKEGLRRIIKPLGLVAAPRQESIIVTSPKRAEKLLASQRRQGVDAAIDVADWPDAISPQEQQVRNAMEREITFDFQETPLRDVVEFLREYLSINIVLEKEGLDIVMIDADTPITLTLEQVKVRNALRFLLDPVDLCATIYGGVLVITAEERAMYELQDIRAYPVADLILVPDAIMDLHATSEHLKAVIQTTVYPDIWTGKDDIAFEPTTLSLVVRHSYLVHAEIEGVLDNLRRIRKRAAKQPDASVPPEWTAQYFQDWRRAEEEKRNREMIEAELRAKRKEE